MLLEAGFLRDQPGGLAYIAALPKERSGHFRSPDSPDRNGTGANDPNAPEGSLA
jgi:hypothetical protein